jgi:hypothetical protein
MSHFKDGSKYVYSPNEEAVNIGWLDAKEEFSKGPVPSEFVCRLKAICRNGVNRTRGIYRCSLCPRVEVPGMQPPIKVASSDGDYVVGGAEIRIQGPEGVVYASPDMIVHYVETHGYRPPDDFIEAVLATSER